MRQMEGAVQDGGESYLKLELKRKSLCILFVDETVFFLFFEGNNSLSIFRRTTQKRTKKSGSDGDSNMLQV